MVLSEEKKIILPYPILMCLNRSGLVFFIQMRLGLDRLSEVESWNVILKIPTEIECWIKLGTKTWFITEKIELKIYFVHVYQIITESFFHLKLHSFFFLRLNSATAELSECQWWMVAEMQLVFWWSILEWTSLQEFTVYCVENLASRSLEKVFQKGKMQK